MKIKSSSGEPKPEEADDLASGFPNIEELVRFCG
jgi:hypothetical protein